MQYYSAIKKNEMVPFAAAWMDLEIIILSKVSQKEKYHINTTQMNTSLKEKTNFQIYKEQTCGCQGEGV